jgi:hypothetical protein
METLISIEGLLEDEQGLRMGELVMVNFRQPSHEFTFSVVIDLISDSMVLSPLVFSLLHVDFGVYCLWKVLALKARLPGKVHLAPCKKVKKSGTN